MKDAFLFWMKSYLGFSRKESKGFILLIPFLIGIGFLPSALGLIKNRQAENTYDDFLHRIDSLESSQSVLETSPYPTFNPGDTLKSAQKQLNNLNRIPFSEADSITLQIVPGIGQATAGRIIKYRENLGGFHSREQLMEVYGMKAETAAAVWEYFDFDPNISKKLNINTSSLEELADHPYISYAEAKVLIAYRNQHGAFSSSEDLLKIKIFKSEWIQKIEPYLVFGE